MSNDQCMNKWDLLFQGTERDDILIGLRKRLGLPPLGAPHQQQHPHPGSNPNVRWHRPGEETVKGAAVAPPPKSQQAGDPAGQKLLDPLY